MLESKSMKMLNSAMEWCLWIFIIPPSKNNNMTKIKKGVMVMARSKSGKNRRRTQIRQQQKRRRKAQKSWLLQ